MNKKNSAEQRWGTLTLFVVTAIISSSVLTGCGDSGVYATTPAKLSVNGTAVNVPYIATINGKEVPLDEYRYYFLNTKYSMDKGDESYWENDGDGSRLSQLKSTALTAMKETYAVEVLAQDLDLTLSSEELAQIDDDVKNQISTLGGAKEYASALNDSYLTDDLYRFLWKSSFYCEKLWVYYFTSGGPYYITNDDGQLTDDQLDEEYQIKFMAIVAEKVDELDVELAPEYSLIDTESLS